MTSDHHLIRAFQALELVIDPVAGHPWLLAPLAVVVLAVLVLASPAGGASAARDPRRGFTITERCEHKPLLWHRCINTPTQGDHIFPWSRGGRTIMSNQQALCPFHNRRKSGTVPSRLYILRLQCRRRRYFPEGESPQVQWRVGAGT